MKKEKIAVCAALHSDSVDGWETFGDIFFNHNMKQDWLPF